MKLPIGLLIAVSLAGPATAQGSQRPRDPHWAKYSEALDRATTPSPHFVFGFQDAGEFRVGDWYVVTISGVGHTLSAKLETGEKPTRIARASSCPALAAAVASFEEIPIRIWTPGGPLATQAEQRARAAGGTGVVNTGYRGEAVLSVTSYQVDPQVGQTGGYDATPAVLRLYDRARPWMDRFLKAVENCWKPETPAR